MHSYVAGYQWLEGIYCRVVKIRVITLEFTIRTFKSHIKASGSVVVKVLCYKPDGSRFETP
jgi:hypothetical protein